MDPNVREKSRITVFISSLLGGTLVFYDKLYVSGIQWTLYILFAGWLCLVIPLPMLLSVRWKNVESHRHVLEYIKSEKQEDLNKAIALPKSGRSQTEWSIRLIAAGLILISVFTALNIILDP
jgi:hypothetical protein